MDHPAEARDAGIDLYWIPLGAGGVRLVQVSGRVYESVKARAERRPPLDLYHTALEVQVPEGRFIVENAWPSPDDETDARGVLVSGPVGSRRLTRFRWLRYEVRCWRDGVVPDIGEAVESPNRVSEGPQIARTLIQAVASVPALTWGRDESEVGDMWNSNSVISWLLTRAGVAVEEIRPPAGGRAPGWTAGIEIARNRLT